MVTIGSNNPSVTNFNVTIASQSNWLLFQGVTGGPYTGVGFGSFSLTVNPTIAATLATGTYTGAITLINPQNANDTTTINLTLTVNGGAGTGGALSVSPTALTFTASPGGAAQPQNLTVTVPANAGVQLNITSFNGPFFSLTSPLCSGTPNPSFGCTFTGSQTLVIVVNPGNLVNLGLYSGSLQFQSGGTTVTVFLTLHLTPPVTTLAVNPTSLVFTAAAGGAVQAQGITVAVPNNAFFQATLSSFNGNFFSVTSTNCNANPATNPTCSFNGNQTLTITVNPATLTAAGTYNGNILLQSGGATVNVPVSLALSGSGTGGGPAAIAAPASLAFFYQTNSTSFIPQQVITVGPVGTFTVSANVATAQQWLIANPVGTTGPGYVVVTVSPQGLAVGTYPGTITINSASGTMSIPVILTVTTGVVVEASPGNVFFSYPAGSAPVVQGITLLASDNSATPVTASTSTPWISVGPPTPSTTPASFTLTMSPAGLCNGLNMGSVTVSAPNAANNGFAIPVVALVSGSTVTTGCPGSGSGSLILGPPALLFTGPANGAPPPPQNLTVTAPSPTTAYTVSASIQTGGFNWLTVQPSGSMVGTQTLTVLVSQTGLAPGGYNGTISLNSNGIVQTVPVTLVVTPPGVGSGLVANPPSLTFSADSGQSAGSQNVTLSTASTTPITLLGVATDSPNFLSAVLSSGSSVSSANPATVTVSATAARLPFGSFIGHITITPLTGPPTTITVTINVGTGIHTGTVFASPPSLLFTAPSGQTPSPQTVLLTTTGSSPVAMGIVADVSWISTSVSSNTVGASSPATLTVSATAANLQPGFYVGHVTIAPSVGTATVIPVTFLVPPGGGTITASPTSLQFAYPGNTTSAVILIGSTNPGATTFNASVASQSNWLLFGNNPSGTYFGLQFGSFLVRVNPAVAATLPTGTYSGTVTLINPVNGTDTTTINLTLTVTGGTNLAVGKTATQSSTLSGYATTGAASAVDGSTDGLFFDGSVTHTNADANAWWQVDLGASAAVSSIVIWNRTDCCGTRLGDYWVFVSDTPFLPGDTPAILLNRAGTFGSHQTTAPNPFTTIAAGAQGRYVRVQLTGTNNLSLAEVQVFGAIVSPAPSNLALGRAASQSSTLPGYATTGAAGAVDGNTDGNFFDGSVTHTNLETNPWWQVDLGASAAVNSIVVWNRTDCCGTRLSDYWVFVSDTPFLATDTPSTLQNRPGTFASHQTTAPNPFSTIAAVAQGRYVRVQLSGINNLSLAEVQVLGIGGAVSGPTNVALGKLTIQSSTLPGYATTGAASAVDGNTDGSFFDGSVSHTNLDPNPWWQVDLSVSTAVSSIVIWNRTDCCGTRLGDYWVFVSDTPFLATDTPTTLQTRPGTFASHQTTAPNPFTTIAAGAQGRYVRVQLSAAGYLSLAEVQVFGQ
jgi:hypothetical protein